MACLPSWPYIVFTTFPRINAALTSLMMIADRETDRQTVSRLPVIDFVTLSDKDFIRRPTWRQQLWGGPSVDSG